MYITIQIFTILGMLFMTYIAFLSFGAPKKNLLFTKAEKQDWDDPMSTGLVKWFTLTNIVGTLTLLATAYLFFIGNSKLFGWVIFMSALTIWFSSYVTNYFTKKILSDKYLKSILASKEQIGGVIATLFWRPDNNKAKQTARIVKWLSILNIVGIIWLEFALFSDIASRLLSISELEYKVIIIFICTLSVLYFTVRYGLRGFVFADAFQSPIIAISALILVAGSIFLFIKLPTHISLYEFFKPLSSYKDCGIFTLHVLFLNLFIVLLTEGHWLRVWIFGKYETTLQVKSTAATALISIILIFIGLFSFVITGSKIGEDSIILLLQNLGNLSPIFIVFFWLGGIAALFSTADAQLYSFLLVKEFDINEGKLSNKLMEKINPFTLSLSLAALFSVAYFLTRYFHVPFEKIVFIIIPMCLNLLPAFVRAVKGYQPKPSLLIFSIILYLVCSIFGILQPVDQMSWTLASALMPILCSIVALKK
jgi:hypothetical protein